MSSPVQTLAKNLKSRQMFPFAISFTTVLVASVALFRVGDDEYIDANNKRFAAPFVKKGAVPDPAAH